MPKFNIAATQTVVTKFDSVEVEAETQDDAEMIVDQMISDDELSKDGEDDETIEYNVTKIAD